MLAADMDHLGLSVSYLRLDLFLLKARMEPM